MKKNILVLAFLLGLTTASFAQSKEEVQAQRATSLEQITTAAKEIGLDEKKTIKLKAIFEELFKTQDEVNADTTLTPEQKKEKLKSANEKKDWKVQNLLGDKVKSYSEVRKRLIAEAAAKKG